MRSFLGKFALISASASLICFGSCERHKPSELSHGEHAEGVHSAPAGEHQDAEHPVASPSPTPAQFFPSPTP